MHNLRAIVCALVLVAVAAGCSGGGAFSSASAVPSPLASAVPSPAAPTAASQAGPTPETSTTAAPATATPTSGASTTGPTAVPEPSPTPTTGASLTRATWTRLRPDVGPAPREDHTWTVDSDRARAYLFGGRAGGTLHGDLWVYDLATDAWTELDAPEGPEPRFGHEAVWLPGRGLVVFAGQAGPRFFNDLWLFGPVAAAWTLLPAAGEVPVARYGSCADLGPDGWLWISHGFTEDGARFSDTRAYDFGTGTWSDETPEGRRPVDRCLHGCWFDAEGALVLYAGQTTGVTALGDLWRLPTPGTDGATWEPLDVDLPEARNLYARTAAFGLELVFGGRGNSGFVGDLWAFDLAGSGAPRALAASGDSPPARSGAELIADVARGRLLLFGGKHDAGTFEDLWQLVLE
ncbi:MAG: hypothetical protein FJ038_05920 [Chloroflexi bacterium]|nr:hypothetical protein [Chloroflexota bacterium]